jgi:hypothetical protein
MNGYKIPVDIYVYIGLLKQILFCSVFLKAEKKRKEYRMHNTAPGV